MRGGKVVVHVKQAFHLGFSQVWERPKTNRKIKEKVGDKYAYTDTVNYIWKKRGRVGEIEKKKNEDNMETFHPKGDPSFQ